MIYLILINIILLIILIIAIIRRRNIVTEPFDNPLETKTDKIDKLYAKLYDKVFDEQSIIIQECKKIVDFVGKNRVRGKGEVMVLECGVGTGKHYQNLVGGGLKVVGLERSGVMMDLFRVRNPLGKVVEGDMRNENLFKGETFSYILCLKDTLYHNVVSDWDAILSNFYYWLKPGGYLIMHVFDREKLDPAPRNMTIIRYDAKRRKHGITNYPEFTHDGWWEHRGKVVCQYNEIFGIRDKSGEVVKKRHYKHNLVIPGKDKIMEKVIGNYFKLVGIEKMNDLGVLDHELCFFKKNKF